MRLGACGIPARAINALKSCRIRLHSRAAQCWKGGRHLCLTRGFLAVSHDREELERVLPKDSVHLFGFTVKQYDNIVQCLSQRRLRQQKKPALLAMFLRAECRFPALGSDF